MEARGGPKGKAWSEEEGARAAQHAGRSFGEKFKFLIWLSIVAALVAAGVGLSVTMVIVQNNREASRPPSPPPPPAPPSDPEGGSGSDSGGGANTGPLPTPGDAPFAVPEGTRALWWDEFDGDALDEGKWSYDLGTGDWGWGNNELESYTDSADNVRVGGGVLTITALQDGNGGYTSGRINSKSHAAFYPGCSLDDGTTFAAVHVEALVKLPAPGPGLWPAFWMMPSDSAYGDWAASGEIDIMESVNAMDTITQGLHYGGTAPAAEKNMTRTRQDGRVPYSDDFHVMAVDWQQGQITVSVDGVPARTYVPRAQDPAGWFTAAADAPPDAPFDQPFYLILNLAVGGLWPGEPDGSTPFPATYTIDYVRVWGTPAT